MKRAFLPHYPIIYYVVNKEAYLRVVRSLRVYHPEGELKLEIYLRMNFVQGITMMELS